MGARIDQPVPVCQRTYSVRGGIKPRNPKAQLKGFSFGTCSLFTFSKAFKDLALKAKVKK